jgi:hypothetical protein
MAITPLNDPIIKKGIFLIYVIFACFIIFSNPVSAIPQCGNLIVTPSNQSSSGIFWHYNISDNIQTVSIDGILLSNFDNQSGIIPLGSADGRITGEHTVRTTNNIDSGCNTSTILPTKTQNTNDTINIYLVFILGLICVIIGFFIPPVGLGAMIFGVIGWLLPNNSALMIILYLVLFIVGLLEIVSNDKWS